MHPNYNNEQPQRKRQLKLFLNENTDYANLIKHLIHIN